MLAARGRPNSPGRSICRYVGRVLGEFREDSDKGVSMGLAGLPGAILPRPYEEFRRNGIMVRRPPPVRAV